VLDPAIKAEEIIFDWAVSNGLKILAMIPQQFSLEEIFRKLTIQGEASDQ